MVCFVLKTVAKMRLGMMRQNLVVNALLNMLFFFSSLLLLLKDANLFCCKANDVCQKHAFILFSTTVEEYVDCTIEHTLQPLDSATYPNEYKFLFDGACFIAARSVISDGIACDEIRSGEIDRQVSNIVAAMHNLINNFLLRIYSGFIFLQGRQNCISSTNFFTSHQL